LPSALLTLPRLVLVTPDGYVHPTLGAQLPINAAGFYIHSAIHKARPEIESIGHCHSTYGKAWSAFGRPVDITNQDSCMFYDNQAVYKSFGGIVLAAEEGARIAAALGPKNRCGILQNHGLLTLGDTPDEVAYLFSALDKQCHIQLMLEAAEANGIKKNIIDDDDAKFTAATIQTPMAVFFSFQGEANLIRAKEPDCLQ
jgi:ribulose-5-phosphate 4-epimerase/fuculose-1-phosphate aldolase